MLLARVSFIHQFEHEEFELADAAVRYLGALLRNGQICGEYVTGWSEGIFQAYVRLSHRTAIEERYLSEDGRGCLTMVQHQFGCDPVWEILDDNKSVRVPTLKSASSLYLFTHGLDADSPVNHGDRGSGIPLHLLPIDDQLRSELFGWAETYSDLDRVWFRTAALELPTYQQLADLNSELSTLGRDLCRQLEVATGKPTFYYLIRHWGDLAVENNRLCPGCGKTWLQPDSPMPSNIPFHKFHFRCHDCRLVSHRAVCFEADGHPEIGAWQPPENT